MLNTLAIKTLSGIKAIKDRLENSEDGASSVEWVLIVAGLAVVVLAITGFVSGWWTAESKKIFPSYTPA